VEPNRREKAFPLFGDVGTVETVEILGGAGAVSLLTAVCADTGP
jgi:hypothetical protein